MSEIDDSYYMEKSSGEDSILISDYNGVYIGPIKIKDLTKAITAHVAEEFLNSRKD